jgi:hypothetical protein
MSYVVLATRNLAGDASAGIEAAPGSGATVTLYDSGATDDPKIKPLGAVWKHVCLTIVSSHDSAANGLVLEEHRGDAAGTWDATSFAETYAAANGLWKYYIDPGARRWRLRYTNSANTLTAFRSEVLGDADQRGS